MKLLFKSSVMLDGKPTEIGQVYEVSNALALELIARHVAVKHIEKEKEIEPEPVVKQERKRRKKEVYDAT